MFMNAKAVAKTKIALIGDSSKTQQVADMVLAELSNSDNVELLERSAIEKVLKEHKLQNSGLSSRQIPVIAKILHTDIFAILSSAQAGKKTIPSSMRVFDARNGFCLLDTALPPKIEECANFISNKLNNLPSSKSMKFVSILAVRNAGAPSRYRRQMAHIAMEIERRLIAIPDIAILERSELGLVNKERKINKKLFRLASSAYLLDLEFAPTDSADKIDLRIYILNSSGQELASFNFPDSLKSSPQKIIKVLAKYLKTSPPFQVASNKEEAERFFNEYKFFHKINRRKIAKCKLDAAISLAPNNPDYLFALVKYIGDRSNYPSNRNSTKTQQFMFMLRIMKEAMKVYDEINERFPDYQKKLYSKIRTREWFVYDKNMDTFSRMAYIFFNNNNLLNKQQKHEVRKFMANFREKYFPEILKYQWELDLDDGINSPRELLNLTRFQNSACDIRYFFDMQDYINFSYSWLVKCLQASSDFLKKNPKYQNMYNFVPSFFPGCGFTPSYKWESSIGCSHALVEISKKHPARAVKNYAYSWELFEQLLQEKFDPKKFRTLLKKYCARHKMFPDKLGTALYRQHLGLYKIFQEEKIEFKRKQKESTPLKTLLVKLKVENDVEKLADLIISHPPNMLELRKRCNSSFDELNALDNFSEKLLRKDSAICLKAFKILNHPFKIKKVIERKDFGSFSLNDVRLKSAVMKGGKIYLLMLNPGYKRARRNEDNDFLKIYCFNPNNKALNEVGRIKESPFKEKLWTAKCQFFVTSNNFLFAAKDQILVIPRNRSQYHAIKDLPAKKIMAMIVLDKRIYAFLGYTAPWTNRPPSETILFSCLLDGSDRKIHISTLRRKKQHFFDKQKPFRVTNVTADEKNHRLLFTCENSVCGLWEFYPDSGKYKAHLKFERSYATWSMKRDDKVYVASEGNYNNYYSFDLKSNKLNFLFYRGKASNIKFMKMKPLLAKEIKEGKPPFLIKEKGIWSSGFRMRYIDLSHKNISSQYLLGVKSLLVERIPILPHSDGHSIWAIAGWSIYKITPPENLNKIEQE